MSFVNPDLIAQGLSPFDPGRAKTRAGRLVFQEIRHKVSQREDFAFETTLAAKRYKNLVTRARESGYLVRMVFFWLRTPELALKRVETRVREGGHNIPEDVVRRRYKNGLGNFVKPEIEVSFPHSFKYLAARRERFLKYSRDNSIKYFDV